MPGQRNFDRDLARDWAEVHARIAQRARERLALPSHHGDSWAERSLAIYKAKYARPQEKVNWMRDGF